VIRELKVYPLRLHLVSNVSDYNSMVQVVLRRARWDLLGALRDRYELS